MTKHKADVRLVFLSLAFAVYAVAVLGCVDPASRAILACGLLVSAGTTAVVAFAPFVGAEKDKQ